MNSPTLTPLPALAEQPRVQVSVEPDPDAALVASARNGDRAALEAIYRKYVRRVYNLVYRMVSDRQVTEDVTQEVFYQVYRNLAMFSGHSRFYTWLFRVATNVALAQGRRMHRHTSRQVPYEDWHPSTSPYTDPPTAAISRGELARVQAALEVLPERHRTMLVLGVVQELPYIDISEILGITVDAVKGRMHRAREALREQLEGVPA